MLRQALLRLLLPCSNPEESDDDASPIKSKCYRDPPPAKAESPPNIYLSTSRSAFSKAARKSKGHAVKPIVATYQRLSSKEAQPTEVHAEAAYPTGRTALQHAASVPQLPSPECSLSKFNCR